MQHRTKLVSAALGLCAAFVATAASAADSLGSLGETRSDTKATVMSPPIVKWQPPQTWNAPAGFSTTDRNFHVGGSAMAKALARLNTFFPVTPCRLVDTRNLFNPAIASPGPFAANEVRVYQVAGKCGVPAAAGRVQAVALAVTTLPTTASGDIEVISNAATLGSTVLMVIQANLWNSATAVTAVDATGKFQVQLRSTPGDMAIDVSGYYADSTTTAAGDFYQFQGSFSGGGLLFVNTLADTLGAAIFASNVNSAVFLANSDNAIDIIEGGVRVENAGANTPTAAFVHVVDASGAGNSCIIGGFPRTVINHPDLNGNPDAIPLAGTSTFAFPGNAAGADDWDAVELQYVTTSTACGGTNLQNHWQLVKQNGAAAFKTGHGYPILVIKP